MKLDGLQVRLRLVAQQYSYFTEFHNITTVGCVDHHCIPAINYVYAPPHQPFEVCVEVDESFTPHRAQVLAVEIEGTSAMKRDTDEKDAQTWSIPLSKPATAMKRTRSTQPESIREHQLGANTFWTRDKSPSKFSSIVQPFLMPAVGGRIKIRIERGRLLEIEPRLPMKEHDPIPPRIPTESELEESTIIDKRWFKRIGGKHGKPIEFEFEICDEGYQKRALRSKIAGAQCAAADDCDDKEELVAIKTEELSGTLETLPTKTDEKDVVEQVRPTPVPILSIVTLEDTKPSSEAVSLSDTGHCALRPLRDGATKVDYDTTSHPIDDYNDPAPGVPSMRNQAETPPTLKKVDHAQFYLPDVTGRPIKKRGRPKGWRKKEHSREANGLEAWTKESTAKRDNAKKGKPPILGRGREQASRPGYAGPPTTVDLKAVEQESVGPRHHPDQALESVLLGGNLGVGDTMESSTESSTDGTDSPAAKKARLFLELKGLEVKERMLSIKRQLLDLGEEI